MARFQIQGVTNLRTFIEADRFVIQYDAKVATFVDAKESIVACVVLAPGVLIRREDVALEK
jgi:hypothetical protein